MSNGITKRTSTTIKGLLQSESFKEAVEQSLPQHLKPDRFVRVALTALIKQPKLKACDQESFFQAMLTCSALGIEPDGRLAHLIPFENRRRGVTEVQLIIDYKGLVDMAFRSGRVATIHADLVCDNDEFTYENGKATHRINFRKERGEMFAAYAICTFKDGSYKTEVMTRDEIDAIRKRSRSGNNGPWVTDYGEMAKKTVTRRLMKWIPLSPEQRDAIEVDDRQYESPALPAATTRSIEERAAIAGQLPGSVIDPPEDDEVDYDYEATDEPPAQPTPDASEAPGPTTESAKTPKPAKAPETPDGDKQAEDAAEGPISYAEWYGRMEAHAADLEIPDFAALVKAIALAYPVKDGRRKGADARAETLQAFRDGNLDVNSGKIMETAAT